jgi:bifunctional DNA primase/polymerase-like protein
MLPALGESYNQIHILHAAQSYRSLRYSVIPLSEKVATIPWLAFQRRHPTSQEISDWFTGDNPHTAIGIITGTISQLAILDFDDPALAQRFKLLCPDLADTRTVQTRRGVHLYFHVPPHLHPRSRKVPGADFLYEGHYVVAPPSAISGHRYAVIRGGQPKTLSDADIGRIEAFLSDSAPVTPAIMPTPGIEPSSRMSEAFGTPMTANDLAALYRSQAKTLGRNEALFWVSVMARDNGWQQQDVLHVLMREHIHQQPNGAHRPERPELRRREAAATVASAFSRPARPPKERSAPGLWNSVREALDQRKLTKVRRVLDGLRLRGVQPGQQFTRSQALRLLTGIVGRDSIYAALAERTIFRVVPPQTPPPSYAATHTTDTNISPANVRQSESGKNQRGRPAIVFVMPSNRELCASLGIRPSICDPVTTDDLSSAKITRHAAHRELVRRRPGLYACAWLAARLGVSKVTLRRYNEAISGLHVAPTYIQTPISRYSLDNVPEDESQAPGGMFLEDRSGKRYPPIRALAGKLLKAGKAVRLVRQTVNYFWFSLDNAPVATAPVKKHENSAFNRSLERFATYFGQHIVIQTPQERPAPPIPVPVDSSPEASAPVSDGPPKKARKRKPNYHKPLPEERLEALAVRAQQTVSQMSASRADHLSLVNARKLVNQYGDWLVGRVLAIMQSRRNIVKPVGFLVIVLHSEAKALARRWQ